MNQVFFESFLMISEARTVLLILILFALFFVLHLLAKKQVDFSVRVIIAMLLGLGLGLVIQFMSNFPDDPSTIKYISETTAWYGLFGNGFLSLLRMLVVPLVIISIIHVIIDMDEGAKMGKLVKTTLLVTLVMVAIAAFVGLMLGIVFQVGKGIQVSQADAEIKEVSSIVTTLKQLIPENPVKAMVDLNVIGLVIFSMIVGICAKRMHQWKPEPIEPFYRWIESLHQIIICVADSIIELLPYGVVALLANTIALRGVASIMEMGVFILVLYLAIIVMFIIQLIQLLLFGINPVPYLKKGIRVMVMAFTSRSSVGTLPLTIDALTKKMGVNAGTAGFVASFGTTAGMQGCAGVFPALLVVFVSNVHGTPIDVTLILMAILVISLGSLGIAGIPGTATMAASVTFSGMGMEGEFVTISPILAIDPVIDMGRTLLNVTGSMVNTITVDKVMGTFDQDAYNK